MRRFALLLVLTLVAAPALAATAAKPVVIKDVPKFLNYQRDLRDDMQKDAKFKHVRSAEKQKLYSAQDELFQLLDGKTSVDQLSDDQKVAVFNAQAQITAVVTDAELDRPLCKRERRIGSNRLETVCETKRQREDARDAAQSRMRTPGACSGDLCKGD